MTNRKQNEAPPTEPADDGGARDLPVHKPQNTTLLQSPTKGVVMIVEQGAQAYFSTCRRLAKFFNRRQ